AGWWRLPYGLLRPIVPKSVRRALSGRAIVEKPDALASQVGFRTECATIVHQQLTDGLFAARAVMHDAIAEQSEIEWRFPFLDRRLVEFMLHVPRGTPFRAGVTKFVLRESMTGILPETIRQRTSVALFSELADRGVREKERARIERLLHCPDVVRLGFAPPDRVMRLVDACRQDGRPADRRALVAMLCVESWLRHRAQAAGAVSRRTPRPEAVGQ
ncbi:MAG: hypothetical protein HYX76_07580, partial [Acidobacteria bacterium]|nr:hypothetical protein [Acidobacteriota bacterium]